MTASAAMQKSSSCASTDYIFALRMAVTGGLFAAAIIFGTLSYLTLAGYELDSAVNRFNSIADYALDSLGHDFTEKENTILAMAKNMAYFKPNESDWPNVVMPGFYDSAVAQRDSSSLSDMFFIPFVPPEKLASYEAFLFDYYDSEPLIGPSGGQTTMGRIGIYALNRLGRLYHDTTGEALLYPSPNKVIAPLSQFLFSEYVSKNSLAFNMHSDAEFGHTIDAIIECSRTTNYTGSERTCVNITQFVYLPLYSLGADVKYVHSALFQPIYLEHNTSKLVGVMAGGFDWVELLSPIFRTSPAGIDIVVLNADLALTFTTGDKKVRWRAMEDAHNERFEDLVQVKSFFGNADGTENESTYVVSMYPSETFINYYKTNTPIYAAVASSILLALCATTFFLYDYYMRKASAANAAVLETKRRFVRFISHEIRTPLNAVHLGLEALIAELRRTIESAGVTPVGANPVDIEDTLFGWLDLATEMMANSDSAEDVLNDLLNYDKIEMGTLRLEFSSVLIWDLVQVNVNVHNSQVKQKNIALSIENHLAGSDGDLEQQDSSLFAVVGDPARLGQVVRNLISNALKFTPNDGSIVVHVDRVEAGIPVLALEVPEESQDLLAQQRAGSVRISVTDSGTGLSEAQLTQIGSEGVKFNAAELQAGKGSGLGLFITKGIVEQHGGKLTVTSAGIGAGTTFAVELPLFRLDERAVLAKQRVHSSNATVTTYPLLSAHPSREKINPDCPPPPPVMTANAGAQDSTVVAPVLVVQATEDMPKIQDPAPEQPKRILAVDDASSNRKMLMRILTAKGYVCEQAEDGQQAIDVYRASVESGLGFYAITMDFEMPVMNGPTATGHLRALGCTVPIIAVTGNMLPADIAHFKTQGATEVLGKPLNVNRFEEVVREHHSSNR